MRVVGTVIVPPTPFLATRLGEGAALALPGYLRIDPGAARQPGGLPFLVRFAPGVSRDAGLAAVAKDIKGLPNPYVTAAERPANVVSLASIAGLPVALSGLLALIAAGTLAHTLASSTRRRRRDLAILKITRVHPAAGPACRRVAGHHHRRHRAAHRAARRHRGRPVGVARLRHPARRAARASRPAHHDLHRHSRRTGAGEPHRGGPRAGSSAHPARHRPQDRVRNQNKAAAQLKARQRTGAARTAIPASRTLERRIRRPGNGPPRSQRSHSCLARTLDKPVIEGAMIRHSWHGLRIAGPVDAAWAHPARSPGRLWPAASGGDHDWAGLPPVAMTGPAARSPAGNRRSRS